MKTLLTTSLLAATIASANAALVTVADYNFSTFADGTAALTAAGFDIIDGNAAVSGGKLVLDGTGAVHDTTSPLTGVTQDFVIEAIATLDGITGAGGSFQFDFFFSHTVGNVNSGFGVVHEGNVGSSDNYVGLDMGSAGYATGTAFSPGETVALALVRQGTTSEIFLNGVSLGSRSAAGFNPAVSQLNIGAERPGIGLAEGSYDRVRLSTITPGTFSPSDLLVVPEPSAALLGAFGVLAFLRRRR